MGFLRIFCRRVTKQFGPVSSVPSPLPPNVPIPHCREFGNGNLIPFVSFHSISPPRRRRRRRACHSVSPPSSQFVSLLAKSMRSSPRPNTLAIAMGYPKKWNKPSITTVWVSNEEFRRHADKTPSRISDCRWRKRKRRTTKRRPAENLPPPPAVRFQRRPNQWPWRGRWQRRRS